MTVPLIFDIETGPAPLDELKCLLDPFDPESVPKPPAEFDPSSVKTGNLKDESKIAAKVESARREHAESLADYERKVAAAESAYWEDIVGRAALSSTTGRVLAIGYRGEKVMIDSVADREERDLLARFWRQFLRCRESGRKMVGYNIAGFDVPFLAQRSWILGVQVPPSVFTPGGWLDSTFVDLMRAWSAGARNGFAKLDIVCRACGIGGKTEGISGADFAGLFLDPESRHVAIEYLERDLEMTAGLAERFGVC